MKTNLKLKKGDRVEKIGPKFTEIGIIGTVIGYGLQSIKEGRECYWVIWDKCTKKTRSLYHIDFLKKITS